MTLTIMSREALPDARLPVEELAAQLRLPDGWDTVPGQSARLARRLAGAVETVEARTRAALLLRSMSLEGRATGGRLMVLPIAPVVQLTALTVDDVALDLAGALIERDGDQTRVCLAQALVPGAAIRVTVEAGIGEWSALPSDLAEAVLIKAENLETLADDGADNFVSRLIAPHRQLRIGRL